MLLLTASNGGESAKEVMLRGCQMARPVQATYPARDETVVANQLTHQTSKF